MNLIVALLIILNRLLLQICLNLKLGPLCPSYRLRTKCWAKLSSVFCHGFILFSAPLSIGFKVISFEIGSRLIISLALVPFQFLIKLSTVSFNYFLQEFSIIFVLSFLLLLSSHKVFFFHWNSHDLVTNLSRGFCIAAPGNQNKRFSPDCT